MTGMQETIYDTFDKVIKTIDAKTKSVGMIIVMPVWIVENVNLIPCLLSHDCTEQKLRADQVYQVYI